MNKRACGTAYEHLAEECLKSCGYQILRRNYRCKAGEIDLIARDAEYLVFVEVRYRRNSGMGTAAESVDAKKRSRILKAALWYLREEHLREDEPCRFDVVAIDGDRLQLIKDAFGS